MKAVQTGSELSIYREPGIYTTLGGRNEERMLNDLIAKSRIDPKDITLYLFLYLRRQYGTT